MEAFVPYRHDARPTTSSSSSPPTPSQIAEGEIKIDHKTRLMWTKDNTDTIYPLNNITSNSLAITINQNNHGFIVGDLIYLDNDGVWKKALATTSPFFAKKCVYIVWDSNNFQAVKTITPLHLPNHGLGSPGEPVYLSNSIAGKMTTNIEGYTAEQVVGFIINSNSIELDIHRPVNISGIDETISVIPAGTIFWHAGNTPPTGFLTANGAILSRSSYSRLFAVIGTIYGAGDGSTTFKLPDLRGEFIRGWDNGRGVDSGRAIGSAQLDQLQGHRHLVKEQNGTQVIGSTLNAGGGGSGQVEAPGAHGGINRGNTEARDMISDATNGTPRIGGETRGRNIALLPIIKT